MKSFKTTSQDLLYIPTGTEFVAPGGYEFLEDINGRPVFREPKDGEVFLDQRRVAARYSSGAASINTDIGRRRFILKSDKPDTITFEFDREDYLTYGDYYMEKSVLYVWMHTQLSASKRHIYKKV